MAPEDDIGMTPEAEEIQEKTSEPNGDPYKLIHLYTAPLKKMERPLIGRQNEIRQIKAALMRPELCNVMLLAEAGSGKTACVQGTMLVDTDRLYLEVDLAKMIADAKDSNEMAAMLKILFAEVADYVKEMHQGIVLFIDEFHQIVQLSAASVEALKPLLADSGTRGIRVIAATTYIEFRKWIQPNQPLVERFQRLNLPEPNKDVVVEILKSMAERYGVQNEVPDDSLYELIYEYTNRYIPSNAQPRKSILILDAMIGWHRAESRPLGVQLLSDVIYESEGVNVSFRVDAGKIKEELDKRVLSQEFATTMIEQRLQICVADLNNKDRPMSSMLFSGSSGVGKACANDTPVPCLTKEGKVKKKPHGQLEIGDKVFNREGKPVPVTGVYPQGEQAAYEVTLEDGRKVVCNDQHIWCWKDITDSDSVWKTNTLRELMRKGVFTPGVSRVGIPQNQPVRYPARIYMVDPYAIGVFIGSGRLTDADLSVSAPKDYEYAIRKVSQLIGADAYYQLSGSSIWKFRSSRIPGTNQKAEETFDMQTDDVLRYVKDMRGLFAHERCIPEEYKYGSVEQRWRLIQGIFDMGGTIDGWDGQSHYKLQYRTSSKRLAMDIREVLFSLGLSSVISKSQFRDMTVDMYVVEVFVTHKMKLKFFSVGANLTSAVKATSISAGTSIVDDVDYVKVTGVRDLKKKVPMTCIMVDDDEHLYQVGFNIVTHNTEVCKCLASVLFESERALIRMDMTEYANPDSLERFRRELTNAVWTRPYSIVLLDEIEKACSAVTRLLLQVLDDGRLMDENNRIVSFVNCYIIMTTNAGSEVYKNIAQYNADDTGSGKQIGQYYKLIRESITKTTGDNRFPPELLGRIDVIVPFQPLSEATMKRIATMNLQKLKREVKKRHGVTLYISKDVVRFLVEDNLDTDSDSGGARAVVSKMESEVTIPIARFINAHRGVKTLRVAIEGELVRDNKQTRVSSAYVVVSEYTGKN